MRILNFKNRKKIIAWSFYDFANQPFATIIITFLYSSFFVNVIAPDSSSGTLMWTNGIAITAIIVSVLSPLLGSLADNRGLQKLFFIFFSCICSLFCILLYFPVKGQYVLALYFFVIANIAFELAQIFYNSYLFSLSSNKNRGSISGFAWGLGFVGGLLALCFSFIFFDVSNEINIRKINILVGCWLLFFSLPAFFVLKNNKKKKSISIERKNIFKNVFLTFKDIYRYRLVFNFLLARLFFNDGLVTIFALGGIYAIGTLGFSFNEVLILGIVLNVCAAIGSFVFGYIEDNIGVHSVINISLITLIFATIIAFIAPETNISKELFWLSASLIGIMIGPNQSCSRSFMVKITPKDKLNEFFGFFALAGKATSFLGPLLFGFITIQYSQQMALLVVLFFFIVGMFLFNRINFNLLD
tara:strand:+ start:85 stop:1326 length:1242 start_codon:yes stop_codon:yes gene_type:complete